MTTRLLLMPPVSLERSFRIAAIACLAAVFCSPSSVAQTTLFVDATAPGPTHNGGSWSTAFLRLQDALAVAVVDSDILLAEGVYVPGPTTGPTRTDTFNITQPLQIYGCYDGYNGGNSGCTTPNEPDGNRFNTFLSGDIRQTPFNPGDNVYHVVTISGVAPPQKVTLDGLRVGGGNADGIGFNQSIGGGILVQDSTLLFADGFVRDNFAAGNGGGIHVSGQSRLEMKNNRVQRNVAEGDGGAIYVEGGTDAVIFNQQFSQNRSEQRGGGLRYSSVTGGSLKIVNSTLFDNQAAQGGGMSMDSDTGSREIINCTIAFNAIIGGGIAGAGIHVDAHLNPVMLYNSIVYNNPDVAPLNNDNVLVGDPSMFVVAHSDLGEPVTGVGMIITMSLNQDPMFQNNTARNLQLRNLSPCLESGDDGLLPLDELDVDDDQLPGNPIEKLDRDIRIRLGGLFNVRREEPWANPAGPIPGVDLIPLGRITDMGAYERGSFDIDGQGV